MGRAASKTVAGPKAGCWEAKTSTPCNGGGGGVPRAHICLGLLAPLRGSEPSTCQSELSKECHEPVASNAWRQHLTKSSV